MASNNEPEPRPLMDKDDIKAMIASANSDEFIPGNISWNQVIKLRTMLLNGQESRAKTAWNNILIKKFEERRKVFQPIRQFAIQLKQEASFLKHTPIMRDCLFDFLNMVNDLSKENANAELSHMEYITDSEDEETTNKSKMKEYPLRPQQPYNKKSVYGGGIQGSLAPRRPKVFEKYNDIPDTTNTEEKYISDFYWNGKKELRHTTMIKLTTSARITLLQETH